MIDRSLEPLSILPWPWTIAIAAFVVVQVLLLVYSAHRFVTLWRVIGSKGPGTAPPAPAGWPAITVQLPLYNEQAVAERLIDAVAGLDYPADRLEVQVLDDSTDDTRRRARDRVAAWRERGVDIVFLHRPRRDGFKAGALAAGLREAKGEILVVFDADFLPGRDFLRALAPHFADPRVGMVQARWEHLNRARSPLTAAQAVMLDAHFLLEHEARMSRGLFFNFNGTAGAWRRACIEDAGGWAHDTLTEDLDLSYRAQMKGWRFVALQDVVAPAEIPSDVLAFKSQQRRWAKGSIQTARKILPTLVRRRLPWAVRLEAALHLTSNVAYPLLLLSGILLVAVITAPPTLPTAWATVLDAAAIACGVLPILVFLVGGQLRGGRRDWRMPLDVLGALAVGAGLTVNNTLAVLAGLRRDPGEWERTPKTGESARGAVRAAYRPRPDPATVLELVLAVYFAGLTVFALSEGHVRPAPFLALLALGLGYVGLLSATTTLRSARRERTVRPREEGRSPVAAAESNPA